MNVIDFKSSAKNKKTIPNKIQQERIDLLEESVVLEFSQVDQEIFEHYIREFPCYRKYSRAITPLDLFHASEQGKLSDSQMVVLSFVLEILSTYEFGFMISDVFSILDRDDQSTFIKIIASHSFLTTREVS